MKKLMFYINAIHHGGAERVIVNLANHFAERGYDVILVTSFRDSWEYQVSEKVDRVSLYESMIGNCFSRNFSLVRSLRNLIKKEKPDSVISFMAEPNFRMLFASLGMKHEKIISVRNDPKREYPNFIFRMLAKTLYCLADFVVFQTKDAQKWFPDSIQKKSGIILNPVDEVFFRTHFEGDRHDIVTTGRLVPQKNHELLIRAFSKISGEITDNLYIYGDGELRSHLESLVVSLGLENRVFLPGAVKNVAETIKSAKLFVLSSDYEGMPNSLMEAIAIGVPCISTDCPCGGPRMLLKKDCLVEGNELSLAKKMLEFLQEKKYFYSYECANSCFTLDEIYKRWEYVFFERN